MSYIQKTGIVQDLLYNAFIFLTTSWLLITPKEKKKSFKLLKLRSVSFLVQNSF